MQVTEQLKPLVTTEEQKQPSIPSTPSPKEDLRELEMQKLKAEMEQKMEQLKLAHEQQLRAAAEKEQRLEAEKQAEIERLKQQHQAELKRSQEESKPKPSQTIATPLKPTPILAIPPALQSRQTLMPTPKLPASAEQLQLQDQLIAACKQGDEKMATTLLKQGAKPDRPNAKGEQPLGAAVWGMCPDVVNALLKQAGSVAPLTWDECEKHNQKHYKEVFIVPKFDPKTFGEWNELLKKIDLSLFVRAYHLKKVEEIRLENDTRGWGFMQPLGGGIRVTAEHSLRSTLRMYRTLSCETELGFIGFRSQIKQGVETASAHHESAKSPPQTIAIPLKPAPMPAIPPTLKSRQTLMPTPKLSARVEQLKLQDQLVAACKQGDEKAVAALLKQGAKPDIANVKGEQPLGAAVWGMCPDVVNTLLKQAGGVALLTWNECEKHNLKYYQEMFSMPKFDPQTHDELDQLLQKMDPNPFLRAFHFKKIEEYWKTQEEIDEARRRECEQRRTIFLYYHTLGDEFEPELYVTTEKGYVVFRTQIKQAVETASAHHKSAKSPPPTIASPLKLAPIPTIPSTSQSRQTLMPTPKLPASAKQLKLQDQLIAACKQGDEKTVTALLKQGAKPDMSDAKREQPLGAAVWGMCPDVVNALLKEAKGIAPMTWDECEKHNQKFYKEVFIVPKFDPQTFGDWNTLLQKIDPNPFVRAFHLKMAEEQYSNQDTSSWEKLKTWVGMKGSGMKYNNQIVSMSDYRKWEMRRDHALVTSTESGYVGFRTQIKQGVETASRPKVEKTF